MDPPEISSHCGHLIMAEQVLESLWAVCPLVPLEFVPSAWSSTLDICGMSRSDNSQETDFTAIAMDMSLSNFILVSCSKPGIVEGVGGIEMTQIIRSLLLRRL